MAVFQCKMCGGTLEISQNESVAVCEYCGTKQTLPRLDDEKRANLYDRANHFRRNNEFDKAMGIYEQILNEDTSDAEAYWSRVLCRYGIEYVEEPVTRKRVPTVNRTQFTSIFADEDYKSALLYADGYQKEVYEEEAKTIDEIQKGILTISQKEEPFDVFICYKETDNNGRRTQDSVLANDLYHQLTQEGFKVFFARITLEDKLGSAYEPYIFAALNSSKVMVVLGTKPEFFKAVWVRNEWSRYLSLMKNGEKKVLIPAYKDMDPYDLPEEFSHLQAQDMSKLGFMQDLIRGIKKLTGQENKAEAARTVESVPVAGNGAYALVERAFLFLEDGDFARADELCEQALNQDPKNPHAYVAKLMIEKKLRKQEELSQGTEALTENNYFQKALRFAEGEFKRELEGYNQMILNRNKDIIYDDAEKLVNEALRKVEQDGIEKSYEEANHVLDEAIKKYVSLSGWRNSTEKIEECKAQKENLEEQRKERIYLDAQKLIDEVELAGIEISYDEANRVLDAAIRKYASLSGWRNSTEKIEECKAQKENLEKQRKESIYQSAQELYAKSENTRTKVSDCLEYIKEAMDIAKSIDDYPGVSAFMEACREKEKYLTKRRNAIVRKRAMVFALVFAIVVTGVFVTKVVLSEAVMLRNQETVSAGNYHTVGLKTDGTVVATGWNYDGQCDVSSWRDIVSVSVGLYHTVGLKSDGTVVAIGDNKYGQCDVNSWRDIVSVSAGLYHTVGLKWYGTVVATGDNGIGQCNVSSWRDIVSVSAGQNHTVGLKSDGTVVATGSNYNGQCNVSSWGDIVSVSVGLYHTVGLKSDGTVVATGSNYDGQCNVSSWRDIVSVSAGFYHTVGLKTDGTVVATGDNKYGQCDVSSWRDIISVSAGLYHTVGLKSDGTVVATGWNDDGQCDVNSWKNIAIPGSMK